MGRFEGSDALRCVPEPRCYVPQAPDLDHCAAVEGRLCAGVEGGGRMRGSFLMSLVSRTWGGWRCTRSTPDEPSITMNPIRSFGSLLNSDPYSFELTSDSYSFECTLDPPSFELTVHLGERTDCLSYRARGDIKTAVERM